ncbi:MAG: SDR family NAD(P)-dependent oxidoreductase [Thermoplasmata archaeon]
MRVLVTGSSRGIGAATVRRLASPGTSLIVHYGQHRAEAEAVASDARRAGAEATIFGADLGEPGAALRLAEHVLAGGTTLDGLVHNAGSYPRQRFLESAAADFEDLYRTNVVGPADLTRALLPALEAAEPGHVVFISSILAFDGARRGAPYAAAKAGQLGLARSLARELAPRVVVNVVAPGSIDTAILAGDTPELRSKRNAAIPLGRIGRPEEVADAVAFLVSDRANYLTGATLHINGGLRME